MSYRNKLDELGITIIRTGLQTCPNCSHMRKAENKKKKCLKVTFESDSVKYFCHNGCGFEGIVDYENKAMAIQPKKKVYKSPAELKRDEENKPLYDFFQRRGIKQATVDKYNIFLSNGWIVFPYTVDGTNYNNKGRKLSDKQFRQSAESKPTLFGIDQIPSGNDIRALYWVEGELDVLTLAEVGKHAVTSNQGGSDKNLDSITNCFEFVDSFDTHIIAVDDDEVGNGLRERLKQRLTGKQIKVINWKELHKECKDANDYMLKTSRQHLLNALNSAKEVMYDGLNSIASDRKSALNFYNGVTSKSYSTGIQSLDDVMRLQTKRLMVVSGYPTKGKSFFIENLLFNTSIQHGWKHLVCSMEGDPNSQIQTLSQMHSKKKMFGRDRMSLQEFEKSLDFSDEHFIRFSMDRTWTVADVLKGAEYAVRRYGVKTLTIDPYNKLQSTMQAGAREDMYISNMLTEIITFARKFDVLVMFAAHPRTARGDDRSKAPTMYDVSGGGNWLNMCDQAVIVHRYMDENGKKLNQTKLIVEKVKDYSIGDPSGGNVYLNFSNDLNKLVDLEHDEPKYDSNIEKDIKPQSKYK